MTEPNPSNPSSSTPAEPTAHSNAILRLLDRPITPADLNAGAALAELPAEPSRRDSVRYLLFRIGDETAALPASILRRVTPAARPVPIPHRTSGTLLGVCNIRGELVLCADLRRLLGLPSRDPADANNNAATGARRMVVLGPADQCWAFEVDALLGIESIDPATLRSPPVTVEHARSHFTAGVADVAGVSVTFLDADRILAGFKAGLT